MTVRELFNILQVQMDHGNSEADVRFNRGMSGSLFEEEYDINGYSLVQGNIDGDEFNILYLA